MGRYFQELLLVDLRRRRRGTLPGNSLQGHTTHAAQKIQYDLHLFLVGLVVQTISRDTRIPAEVDKSL